MGARRYVSQAGFSLIELTVTVVIIGILAAVAVPRFYKVFEQSRVDLAAGTLRVIWTAQRLYWLNNRTYALSLTDLETAGVLDGNLAGSAHFSYGITTADATSFQASAVRINSGWQGSLAINEQGVISGVITKGGDSVQPSPQD